MEKRPEFITLPLKSAFMELSALTAIGPIDGRYRSKVEALSAYFSEYALIRYRVLVEVEYLITLADMDIARLPNFDGSEAEMLRDLYRQFSVSDAEEIKNTEKTTNHDVKAVEYFVKDRLDKMGRSDIREFVHFGLTSQDINNTSVPLSMKEATEKVMIPALEDLVQKLEDLAGEWSEIPMLARTHGQPASPTRLGKEIEVFVARLKIQLEGLKKLSYGAKFGGATGNMNAHYVSFPNMDWHQFARQFVNNSLGLSRSYPTTQIEHYDHLATWCDQWKRINTILIDLDRDMWTYISMEYFKQRIKEGEVGSSAMPHKVNPIDFENSEGNLGISNAVLEHLAAKLPISRLQRDLTDSTVLRNVGVPMAHTLIGIQATAKGLGKLLLNTTALEADLEDNWAVVAEAIQNILRREGYPNPYEALKDLTRTNEAINRNSIHRFIDGLNIENELKEELKRITPSNYTGK
jgi:adenylosuccinate lyase